ncbi:hypothetical protein QBZ16_002229 [Prototheca wickerhamii]|uniref:Uncharacterized protein n=1 Tax=Prototheca wickerhamii TaxID=3111 RepID=A0AAD9IJS3_PROWI|nr:hypothetical protein QBZ16_002229 [Prototheca wickerhamii]
MVVAPAVTAVGMRSLHGDSSQDNVQAPDPDQKLYSQERTGGGAYADRDDPKAQVQPTEGKADEDIVQKDTAAKAVSPEEVDHAEGGKPVEDGEKAQESVLGVAPSGGG